MGKIRPLLFLLAMVGGFVVAGPTLSDRGSSARAPLAQATTERATPSQAQASSKIWIGRHAEFEQALRTAPIDRIEDIGTGVTRPRRAFFAAGSLAQSGIVKAVNEGPMAPYLDSYRAEIAAYELDRILGLDMVPPTVERRIDNELRSVQLWVENTRSLKNVEGKPVPDQDAWNRQIYRMRVFDNLIVNTDRNPRNVLIDPAWNIILIDHSRSFDGRISRMRYDMTKIDREFLERVRRLDKKTLNERIGRYLQFGVGPLLQQRDRIVSHFERLVREQGEGKVFVGERLAFRPEPEQD
ncbi:MAG: hypothetical protein ACE148_15920 [Vicinamibacterales bacterium]